MPEGSMMVVLQSLDEAKKIDDTRTALSLEAT